MNSHTRRPGSGPRQAEAIYTATLDLLGRNGFDALTIEGVAERSGVNKTTIYRWWPDKDALLADAFINADLLRLRIGDTGSLRGDLLALTDRVAELLTGDDTAATVTAAFGAAVSRPALGALARDFFADRLDTERIIFDRAVARGELPSGIDVPVVVDMLMGALWTRLVLRGSPLPDGFTEQVVDALLDGIGPGRRDRAG